MDNYPSDWMFLPNKHSSKLNSIKTRWQQQFELQNQIIMQPFFPAIGVLRSIWNFPKARLHGKSIATAFAITPRLLITATHNVYAQKCQDYANWIEFVPGIQQGQKPSQFNTIMAYILNKRPLQSLAKIDFSNQPIKEELTLLYLKEPISLPPYSRFPQLGSLQHLDFNQQADTLYVAGYPNMYIQCSKFRQNSGLRLVCKQGKVSPYKTKDFAIHYEIKTSAGVSGGPVFGINKKNEAVIVGMHTHPGNPKVRIKPGLSFNSGLLFTAEILQKIKEAEREFLISHCDLRKEVKMIHFYRKGKKQQAYLRQINVLQIKQAQQRKFSSVGSQKQAKRTQKSEILQKEGQKLLNTTQTANDSQSQELLSSKLLVQLTIQKQEEPPNQKGNEFEINPPPKSQNEDNNASSNQGQYSKNSTEKVLHQNAQPAEVKEGSQSDQSYENLSEISASEYNWIIEQQSQQIQAQKLRNFEQLDEIPPTD